MKEKVIGYKLAQSDGWDFRTGEIINYRDNIGRTVKNPECGLSECPNSNPKCEFLHISEDPNDCFGCSDCFIKPWIPCSVYRVEGRPIYGTEKEWGFTELFVIEEITDLDTLFGWRYSEAINPIHPLAKRVEPTEASITLLREWAKVRARVRTRVLNSVKDTIGHNVWGTVSEFLWDFIGSDIWNRTQESARDSVEDHIEAYVGSLFSNIREWKYIEHEIGRYPYQSAVDLWKWGLIASFDGETWRLHSGPKADIVFEISERDLLT